MQRSDSSEIWRTECETIYQEMERLILSAWPRSQEENQVRKIRFAALIERRNSLSYGSNRPTQKRGRIERGVILEPRSFACCEKCFAMLHQPEIQGDARRGILRWPRSSEQLFRVDKWSICRG
jgi:hypothetical protein